MKRTLLLTLDFAPAIGGVATYWANLCKYLPREDIVVLAPETDATLDFDIRQPYLIFRYNLLWRGIWSWPRWLPFLYYAWKVCRREKIEQILVGQILPAGTIALILKFFLHIPYFVSVHGMDVSWCRKKWRKRKLAQMVLAKASGLIVNSEFTLNLTKQLFKKVPEKQVIVYPCPNEQVILAPAATDLLLDRIGLAKLRGRRALLTVSRLVERKGHDKVLTALSFLKDKYPDLVYLIVGRGPLRKKLEELTESMNLSARVFFFENIRNEELPLFYRAADLFVMPSRELPDGDVEGFGIVYLEAGTFSKPVIAGRSGGVPEAVLHNETGILVDGENVGDIVKAVSALLDDRQKADLFGQQAWKRIKDEFRWNKQAKKLLSILS
jgi:phosphatidylinositol alpha-1,6-mannosyltransferase